MTENNEQKDLVANLLSATDKIVNKNRPTLSDIELLRLFDFIGNNSSLVNSLYRPAATIKSQYLNTSMRQQAEASKINKIASLAIKYYKAAVTASYQLGLHAERAAQAVNYVTSFERTESVLAAKLGQDQARELITSTSNGLLCLADAKDFNKYLLDTQYNGIYGIIYLNYFYVWIDVAASVYGIPELRLLKDFFLQEHTQVIQNSKATILESIVGDAAEKTTKLNRIEIMFNNVILHGADQYQPSESEIAEIEKDLKAFRANKPNCAKILLNELVYFKQEKINECIKS